MKSIAVFCGSSSSNNPFFWNKTKELGRFMARNQIQLIYGGANVGLMGILADSCLEDGGEVIGVIPDFLKQKEIAHPNISELIFVHDMQERKKKMQELADGFMVLPGGFGTLDELFEMLTWAQLGHHSKPIGILNLDQYYTALLQLLKDMEKQKLLKGIHRKMVLSDESIPELFQKMINYSPNSVVKWIN